mmetsp:Transcript_7884/g.17271  ORF Transcript_7884/g.17271 Transcript_7884/m.17271 type:complete len:121 (-) Transcript_7884:108-470(-)
MMSRALLQSTSLGLNMLLMFPDQSNATVQCLNIRCAHHTGSFHGVLSQPFFLLYKHCSSLLRSFHLLRDGVHHEGLRVRTVCAEEPVAVPAAAHRGWFPRLPSSSSISAPALSYTSPSRT